LARPAENGWSLIGVGIFWEKILLNRADVCKVPEEFILSGIFFGGSSEIRIVDGF
jgi:hypothetical protein